MLGALLITLREGLEAALIVGIILAYLARTNNKQGFKPVWLGIGMAVLLSLIAGAVIDVVAGTFEGRAEQIFEGTVLFLAVGVLTWMVFWMRKQAVNIKGELHAQIQSALSSKSSFGLVTIAFVGVLREGIETVLFLFAATRVSESPLASTAGGLLGLALAIVIGYGVYKGTSRLNLKTFFNITGLALIIFAAGLFMMAIGEYHEAGIIPTIVEHVWDLSSVLSEDAGLGLVLRTLFGYTASPSLVQAAGYVIFLAVAMVGYFRRPASAGSAKPAATARVQA